VTAAAAADPGVGPGRLDGALRTEYPFVLPRGYVDDAGVLVGVISQTDLLRTRATEYLWENWAGLRVKHLMTTPALTIRKGHPLAMAARKMERHHVHRLVVVADEDETLPIGMISTSDVVHAMSAYPSEAGDTADAVAQNEGDA